MYKYDDTALGRIFCAAVAPLRCVEGVKSWGSAYCPGLIETRLESTGLQGPVDHV